MAEALCVDSWSRQRQESNHQIYTKINEMRAWMGMPLLEVPSYEAKKEKPDYLQSMRKACERAAEIVERMKRWQTRSQDSVNEADVAILGEHSDKGGNADLEAKPAKSKINSGPGANVQQREILECPSTEIRAPKGLFPLEVTYYESYEYGNSKLSDSSMEIKLSFDANYEIQDRHFGGCRPEMVQDRGGRHSFSGSDDGIGGNRRPKVVQEMELQKVESKLVEAKSCSCGPVAFSCEQQVAKLRSRNQPLSRFEHHLDAQTKSISDLKQGNGINSTLDLVHWDEKKFSIWMKNRDEWDFVTLDDVLGIRNLDMQPLDVDDNVGTRQIESLMMQQYLISAHELFEKMPEKKLIDVDETVALLIVPSLFTFDPGKSNEFPIRTGWVETSLTLVFDPGGTEVVICNELTRDSFVAYTAC